MAIYSIGDQARAYAMQSAIGRTKLVMNVLLEELGSGEVHDVAQKFGGNTQALRGVENQIILLEQFQNNSAEAEIEIQAMLSSLDYIRAVSEGFFLDAMNVSNIESEKEVVNFASRAEIALESVISSLNTEASGRYIFSGARFDLAPFASVNEIIDSLQVLVAGANTAENVVSIVSSWFDAPVGSGGFVDVAYRGGLEGRDIPISPGNMVSYDVPALSSPVLETLKGLAMAALVGRGVLNGNALEQRAIVSEAGMVVFGGSKELVSEQGNLGGLLQHIEVVARENDSALSAMYEIRNGMRWVDPDETVVGLSEVEARMQAIFTVYGRLSRMNLADYL